MPRRGPGVFVHEPIGLKREELCASAQHIVTSNSVDSSDLDIIGAQSVPDEVEGLRLAKDWALVRGAILARPARHAFAQPRVLRVIDAV